MPTHAAARAQAGEGTGLNGVGFMHERKWDITRNHVVEDADRAEVVNAFLAAYVPGSGNALWDRCDVNGDGVINVSDAQLVANYVAYVDRVGWLGSNNSRAV